MMLGRMQIVKERMDEIRKSLSGFNPNRSFRNRQAFADQLADAQTAHSEPVAPPVTSNKITVSQINPALFSAADPKKAFEKIIMDNAARNNLSPDLVKRMIEVESGFDPKAVSRKGAMGLMQLMPQTATMLGVTDPFDPAQNIAAGTDYLASLLKQNSGNIELALASYNAGPGAVRRHGGVPPFRETREYIKKILENLPKKGWDLNTPDRRR